MPQLNPEFFVSQIFWLVITFSFLLIFLWKISLPRISSVLEKRKEKINNDIEIAKKLQTEAEEIQNNIDKQLLATNDQVATLIKETSNNLQNKATNHLKKIDEEFARKIIESANEIEKNKNDSLKNIKDQIQEIAKLTLLKLTDITVTDNEMKETIKTIQDKKQV